MNPSKALERVVFDCNVFLQALANPTGPAGACFQEARIGNIQLFVSPDVLKELSEVAARPILKRKLRLSEDRLEAFIFEILKVSDMIQTVPAVFTHPVDMKDALYIDLAIAAEATVITSRDKHLLKLRDPNTSLGREFIQRYPSIDVLTPVHFLERIRSN